jgi:DNA polymerase elongation subunit (family B)
MAKIEFYPIDISYETNINNRAAIQLFGRTSDGKRVCVLDATYDPYFYVEAQKKDQIKRLMDRIATTRVEGRDSTSFVLNTELKKMNFLGGEKELIKVNVNNPSDIAAIKNVLKEFKEIKEIYFTDLLFVKKYLVDREITPLMKCVVEGEVIERSNFNVDLVIKAEKIDQAEADFLKDVKIMGFDIEVYTPEKMYPSEEKDPIIMLAMMTNKGFKKVLTWREFKGKQDYVEVVASEADLLRRFVEILEEEGPDYLVGYFSDGFDLPYIKTRSKINNVRISFNNSVLRVNRKGRTSSAKIKGLVHLDIFKFIRNIMGGSLRLDNYSLDRVAKELLNESKKGADLDFIGKAWDENSKELANYCEYNLHDANLALELLKKILPNMNEIVKLVGLPLYDVCRMSYSKLVEYYLIKRAKEFDELIPNKPGKAEIALRRTKTYAGASVIEPKPGLYENVVVFDFRGFWPSILVAHNISISTLTDSKKNSYESPEITDEFGKKVHYYFTHKKEGFIPQLVRDLISRRNRVKELLKKDKEDTILEARYYALKTITNATYGYYAFFGARWYCREGSASITAWGREYIHQIVEKAEENNFGVIYSDTDSIFLELGDKTKDDALKFLEEENRELPSLIELELENFYKRGIFVMKKGETGGAKKKYALISEDGKIKVRGFETIRRDWSLLAKETQKKVLDIILKKNDKEKALKYVKEIVEKVKEKKIEKEKMIITTQLVKGIDSYDLVGPHVVVARKMKEKGIFVGPGSIIKYIVAEGKGRIRDKAVLPEECQNYDSEYYINNQVIPAVERIFDALGYSEEELVKEKEQSSLHGFMKK